jgi:hypothetical protein
MELDRLEASGCDAITNDIGRAKTNPADLETKTVGFPMQGPSRHLTFHGAGEIRSGGSGE